MAERPLAKLIAALREPLMADAYEKAVIIDFTLAERLAQERNDAADTIEATSTRLAMAMAVLQAFAHRTDAQAGTDVIAHLWDWLNDPANQRPSE